MRIGMVVPTLGFAGGVERHVWDLARALKERGHPLRLIHHGGPGRDPEKYCAAFDDVVSSSAPNCAEDLDVAYVHRAEDVDELAMLGDRPAVIAVHDHMHTCPRTYRYLPFTLRPCHRPPGIACVAFGCCVIRDRRKGAWFPVQLRNPFVLRGRLTALAARGPMVACSGYIAANLVRAGADPGRVHVVHPVPPEDAGAVVPRPNTHRLLVVGTLVRGKGVDLAIKALARLPDDCKLDIAGEGPSRDELQTLAGSVAPGRVRFLGYIPPDELSAIYDQASVVVVPARWPEPFGMTGIEAMRRGRPVAGAAHGGIPEWLAHGRGGLLFSPGSIESLANAARLLLEDQDAGTRARNYVAQEFSYAGHVDQIEKLLVSVARGNGQ